MSIESEENVASLKTVLDESFGGKQSSHAGHKWSGAVDSDQPSPENWLYLSKPR